MIRDIFKTILLLVALFCLIFAMASCGEQPTINPDHPVTGYVDTIPYATWDEIKAIATGEQPAALRVAPGRDWEEDSIGELQTYGAMLISQNPENGRQTRFRLSTLLAYMRDSVQGTDSQTLSLASNVLTITGGNNVSLSAYLDNTDAQTLTATSIGDSISVSNGNSILLPYRVYGVDALSDISSRSFPLNSRIINRDNGATYKVQASAVSGYTTDNIAVIPTGSRYAVLQPVDGKFDVVWFGADNTDVANCSTPVTNAIKMANITGDKVFFSPGNYVASVQILIDRDVTIEGEGATLRAHPTLLNNLFWINSSSNVVFDGMILKNESTSIDSKIKISSTTGAILTVKNCTFTDINVLGTCISVASDNTAYIDNNKFQRIGNAIRGGAEYYITRNKIDSTSADGINLTSNTDKAYIANNVLTRIWNYPIHVAPSAGVSRHITIEGNYIQNDTISYCDGGSADQISIFDCEDVVINHNWSIGGGDMGITLEHVKNAIVSNNISSHNAKSGIVVGNNGGISSNVVISGNVFYNNGQHPNGTTFSRSPSCLGNPGALGAIFIENEVDSVSVTGNIMYDDQDGAETQDYDIYHVDADTFFLIYEGNLGRGITNLDPAKINYNYLPKRGAYFRDTIFLPDYSDGTLAVSGGKVVVGVGSNIYGTDGTLTEERIFDLDGFRLVLDGVNNSSDVGDIQGGFVLETGSSSAVVGGMYRRNDGGAIRVQHTGTFGSTTNSYFYAGISSNVPSIILNKDDNAASGEISIRDENNELGEIGIYNISGADEFAIGSTNDFFFRRGGVVYGKLASGGLWGFGSNFTPTEEVHLQVNQASATAFQVTNTTANVGSSAMYRATTDGVDAAFIARSSLSNGTLFGQNRANTMNIYQITGTALLFGTSNTAPLYIGTNNVEAMEIETDQDINIAGGIDMTSTADAFLPPRLTTTQRNALVSPGQGSLIYNTTVDSLQVRTSSAWRNLNF